MSARDCPCLRVAPRCAATPIYAAARLRRSAGSRSAGGSSSKGGSRRCVIARSLSPQAWQRPGGPESALPAARPGSEVSMSNRNWRAILAGVATAIAAAGSAGAQTVCTPTDTPPATVLRDRYGVPHIFASNLDDLSFTNGYVEAQDRLFEMEIFRRAGEGTLSAVLGASFLEMDASIRRDLYTAAERQAQFDALGADDRRAIGKFADGVNLYICQARLDASKMPAEYAALGFLPADWTAQDTVAGADFLIGVFGAFGGDEVRNAAFFFDVKSRLRRARAKRVFNDHFPIFDPQSPVPIPMTEKTYDDPLAHSTRPFSSRQLKVLEKYLSSINAAAGVSTAQAQAMAKAEEVLGVQAKRVRHASNAILVSGALSETGNPILLGGPQVGYAIPSFFFEVGLHAPGLDAVGV